MILKIIMSITLIIISMFQFVFCEESQKITGTVLNEDGDTIENVSIQIKELNLGTVSDNSGYFSLSVNPGVYKLLFSHIGYENLIIDLESGENKKNKIILRINSIKNRQLVVTANKIADGRPADV